MTQTAPAGTRDDQLRSALARVCRLAFDDLPAAEAMTRLTRDDQAVRAVAALPESSPPNRDFARTLRARLEPGWPTPADAATFARRVLTLRSDIATRRRAERGLDEDCEEFALLRAVGLLTGLEISAWPDDPEQLPGLIADSEPTGRQPNPDWIPVCVRDIAITCRKGLFGPGAEAVIDQAGLHAWFGTACAIAVCYHQPRTPAFDAALELLISAGPPATTPAEAHKDAVVRMRAL